MNLTSSKKVDTNRHELEIAVGAEEFEKAIQSVYRKQVKNIQVPGFRKGKAPRHIVEKMYGEGVFYEDAINDLYPSVYTQAVTEANITPVDRADIEVLSVGKDGFTFKATVTVKPEVEVANYKGIAATKKVKKISDKEIDAEISRLQERNSRMVDVDDRPAEMGDYTIIDFDGYVDGVAFDGGKSERYPITLGSGQFIPGFEEQIAGHSIGDEFDVNVTFPEDYHAEELKGKAAVFKVKLHEIKKKELPEVDDEFAKDVSEFDTLAELREDLGKKLQESADKAAKDAVENQLIDSVIADMKAEIPEVMFEHRIDEMIQDFDYRLSSQGLNLQTYLQYTGMEMDSFRKTFREQAERQVKIRLALEKIVELEGLTASPEDVEAEYAKLADAYKIEVEKVKTYIPETDVTKDIAVNKAIDLVRDNAVITEEEEAEENKAEADAEKAE